MTRFLLFILFTIPFFTNCKNQDRESGKIESNSQEVFSEIDSLKTICKTDSNELTKFIFSTRKDVNIFDHFEYDEHWDKILDNAKEYETQVLSLLNCSNLTESQKGFLIHAMNGLSFEEYIEFIDRCFDKYLSNRITLETFEFNVIFNIIKHRHYVSKYYQNEKIIELLTRIKSHKTIRGTRLEKRIDKVLSGEHWKEKIEFYSGAAMDGHTELLEGW
ncbi:hypothetical protein [uncultured Psychroserpens sp.]|uniref:hypothetical protein n=1 Tax=uncultured Psychroserpens sp. TaxID=255436 RepID=UPI00261042CD|nr:hypothetical protein [uncultured Psychroserpens sp.]